MDPHPPHPTWLFVSYVLWARAVGVGSMVLGHHARGVARSAAGLVADGVTESDELRAEASKPVIKALGMVEAVIIVTFLYLMTAKPGA